VTYKAFKLVDEYPIAPAVATVRADDGVGMVNAVSIELKWLVDGQYVLAIYNRADALKLAKAITRFANRGRKVRGKKK
jgi:hypothetical protein